MDEIKKIKVKPYKTRRGLVDYIYVSDDKRYKIRINPRKYNGWDVYKDGKLHVTFKHLKAAIDMINDWKGMANGGFNS
jgi:hypothetical protein